MKIDLRGKARRLHLLVAGTTFPQATGSTHVEITVGYQDGSSPNVMLRSPQSRWPVEQDYPVDDFILLLGEEEHPLPWRIDLAS